MSLTSSFFVRRTGHLVMALAALCALAASVHGEVTVNATLSHRSAEIGEPVQLQVGIAGHRGSVEPPAVKAEGLNVEYVGPSQSRQIEMSNGGFRQQTTTTFMYRVTPRQAGSFQIPALALTVDGQTFRTQPVGLKVEKGSGAAGGTGEEQMAFAELTVPRKTAYVGEMLPVELNFYLDANVNAELEQMPGISGTGFTSQKMPEPRQQRARKNGREWKVVTFRTAITPSKAGQITLGPMEIAFVAEKPRQRIGSRDPFDAFFNDPFFDRMRGGERRRYTVQAPAMELDVKSLPTPGKPAEFSGAIGQFKFAAEGSPKRVKLGDPVTMRLKISGTGNFDRMQAPALVDTAGWHPYPASESYEPADDLKMSGTKTFEIPIVPETKQTAMPRFEFAYFDPEKATYVALTSDSAPLVVEGTAAPAPIVSTEAAPARPSTPAAPVNPPAANDILGLRYDLGSVRTSAQPLYQRREFLLAQLAPLALLVALLGSRFLRRNGGATHLAALRRERERLQRALRRSDDGAGFYETAARLVQVQTALATGINPAAVDAPLAQRSLQLDEEASAAVEEVFSARAELLYAGTAGNGAPASPNRERIIQALEHLSKARA